jgi:hypothetical protein
VLGEIARAGMTVGLHVHVLGSTRLVFVDFVMVGKPPCPRDWPRFAREVRTLGHFRDLILVPLFQVGESQGRASLGVTFGEGGLLRQLTQPPAQPEEVGAVLDGLASAVYHAHQDPVLRVNLESPRLLIDAEMAPHLVGPSRTDGGAVEALGTILAVCLAHRHVNKPQEAIGLKCPTRAAGRIWASAAELAGAVERWLHGEPK